MANTTTVHVSAFVKAILRAVVRWCLARGVRFAQVEELLRQTFVEEAEREIRAAQGEFSVSKVSVMTGLHRTEVSRLLSGETKEAGQHDVLNRVVGLWSSSKRYRNHDGTPRQLTHEGLASEFAELVADISKEVTHYPILFELERIGAIEYEGSLVKLIVQGYTPQEDMQYGLDLLTSDVSDLTAAIEGNILKKYSEPNLHLRTSFDNIDPDRLAEIRSWLSKKGAEFQSVVREYLATFDRDVAGNTSDSAPRAQVSVTSFANAEPVQITKTIMPKKRGRKKCS
jgi:hypothetical protein